METSTKIGMALWKKIAIGFVAFVIILNVIGAFLPKPEPVKALLSIKEVSGKSEADVEKILGKGKLEKLWKDEKAGCKACPKYIYQDGKYEVIFIDGAADRITINGMADYEYKDESILGSLGLPVVTPTSETDLVKRWNGYEGYKEIMAFNANGKVDYVLVKSKAE